jgi:hypothetical protein
MGDLGRGAMLILKSKFYIEYIRIELIKYIKDTIE